MSGSMTRAEFLETLADGTLAFFAWRMGLFPATERYVATARSIGYGWGWDDWEVEAGLVNPTPDELTREALAEGDPLVVSRDPDVPDDAIWAAVTTPEGAFVCDIPFNSTPEQESLVNDILHEVDRGRAVKARVVSVEHRTMSDHGRNERVHDIVFDVYSLG